MEIIVTPAAVQTLDEMDFPDWIKAQIDGRFTALDALARSKGERIDSDYVYRTGNIDIAVCDSRHIVIVMNNGRIVASNNPDNPRFIPGKWWLDLEEEISKVEAENKAQIQQAEAAAIVACFRESVAVI